jgi:diguanylate cyclase (GGDEF)-like protein
MKQRRSWLCPDDVDRQRVVEASDRVRKARTQIWGTVGIMLALSAPWNGWWVLLLFLPAGINLAILEVTLKKSNRPERWAIGTMAFMMCLFAAAVPLTGGPSSPAIPLVLIPAAVAPMRFRGQVVAAFVVLTALVLLGVAIGSDPAGFANDPRWVMSGIAAMVCVTLANWALVKAEMDQREAATLDPLTSSLNRKALELRFPELEQQAQLTGASVALIACDLDRFKDVNDTYGHDRGDAVLRSFAYQVRKALRSFELIYRLGGEEFLIVLPGSGHEEAVAIAERLRQTIEEGEPGGLQITASFGVSAAAGEQVDYTRMFKAADTALYKAKEGGRNRVVAAVKPEPAPPELEPALAPAARTA